VSGIVITDEDCGDDNNVSECVAKINLKTILTCYTDTKFTKQSKNNNTFGPGDIAYC